MKEKEPLRRNIHPMDDWEMFLKEGKKEFNELYNRPPEKKYKRNDFNFFRILGKGAFGHVYLAVLRKTGTKYAIKTMEKYKIVKSKHVYDVKQEKKILQAINFPFCIHLEMSFQSPLYIYMSLPYLPGGDIFKQLKLKKRFDDELSKFYGSQVLLALEYLHYLRIVHRDVKPENIVIDSDGFVKLTDFGFCKKVGMKRTYTFCGTPEYMAPEIILHKGYGTSVDWWSFGVLIYEMSAGYTPFKASDPLTIFKNVLSGKYSMPGSFCPALSDLIRNLLQLDLSKRLGNLKKGVRQIKRHPWFESIDWIELFNYSVPVPYVPPMNQLDDLTLAKDVGSDLKFREKGINQYTKEFADF